MPHAPVCVPACLGHPAPCWPGQTEPAPEGGGGGGEGGRRSLMKAAQVRGARGEGQTEPAPEGRARREGEGEAGVLSGCAGGLGVKVTSSPARWPQHPTTNHQPPPLTHTHTHTARTPTCTLAASFPSSASSDLRPPSCRTRCLRGRSWWWPVPSTMYLTGHRGRVQRGGWGGAH